MMKPDKAVLKALKSCKSLKDKKGMGAADATRTKAFEGTLTELPTESAKNAVTRICDWLGRREDGGEGPFPRNELAALVATRLNGSAEYVFLEAVQELVALDAASVVLLAATPRCLAAWVTLRAKAPGTKEYAGRMELVDLALAQHEVAVKSPLAQWFIGVATPKELPAAAEFFRSRESTGWQTSREELLGMALERDTTGAFGRKFLDLRREHPADLESELGVIRAEAKLFDEMVRLWPMLVVGEDGERFVKMLPMLFADVAKGGGGERRRFSARLTKLASGFLSMNSSKPANDALRELDSISQALESSIAVGDLDPEVCGVRYGGSERKPTGDWVNENGAQVLAIAIQKIKAGEDALATLADATFNLGMRGIAKAGDTACFDPIRHEDTVGGMYPGDPVVVVDGGWTLGEQIIERPKVKKA